MDGWIKSIKKGVKTVRKKIETHQIESAQKVLRQKSLRQKSLPMIRNIAHEYGARVDPLDTAAYVHKGEHGVHINYNTPTSQIRVKLEKTFIQSATLSKITKGVRSAAVKVRKAKGELRKMKKEFRGAFGGESLYPDVKLF